MTTKRQTQITIETHSLTIIKTRTGGKSNSVYCRRCKSDVATFRHAHAALIFRVDAGELERLSQIGLIHAAGRSDLCANSLAEHFRQEIRFVKD